MKLRVIDPLRVLTLLCGHVPTLDPRTAPYVCRIYAVVIMMKLLRVQDHRDHRVPGVDHLDHLDHVHIPRLVRVRRVGHARLVGQGQVVLHVPKAKRVVHIFLVLVDPQDQDLILEKRAVTQSEMTIVVKDLRLVLDHLHPVQPLTVVLQGQGQIRFRSVLVLSNLNCRN